MKTKAFLSFLLAAGTALSLAACGDDDDPSPEEPAVAHAGINVSSDGSYTLYRKTDYGDDWIYVNLSSLDTVAVSEETHRDDLSWDIAFNRYNIRTNSGTSGIGNGGAIRTESTKLADVTAVPAGVDFTADTDWEITKMPTMDANGFIPMASSANPLLSTAITIIVKNGPPDYNISDDVFLIRTADGSKVFKFKTVSFFNERGQSGFYNFMLEELK